jgi:hypothetical protein
LKRERKKRAGVRENYAQEFDQNNLVKLNEEYNVHDQESNRYLEGFGHRKNYVWASIFKTIELKKFGPPLVIKEDNLCCIKQVLGI